MKVKEMTQREVVFAFNAALKETQNKAINDAFAKLGREIETLNSTDKTLLYVYMAELLGKIRRNEPINLNLFKLQYQHVLDPRNPTLYKCGLAFSAIALGLAAVVAGLAIGFGVGVLLGLWVAPMAFLVALLASNLVAIAIVAGSVSFGLGVSAFASFLFFRKSSVKKACEKAVAAVEIERSELINQLKNREVHRVVDEREDLGEGFEVPRFARNDVDVALDDVRNAGNSKEFNHDDSEIKQESMSSV